MSSTMDHPGELVVSGSLDIGAGCNADGAMVLRAFDQLRREVALQVDGQAGMGLDYDLLDITWAGLREVRPNASVALVALLLRRRPGRHEVEYVASVLARPEDPEAGSRVIVRARGWTLSPKKTPVDPAGPTKD